jgi:general secretion pathway protein G
MRRNAGFTLMELLVVILIITILSTVVGVQLAGRTGDARCATAKAQLGNFRLALKAYTLDNSCYPTQEQGLQALVEPSTIAPVPRKFPKEGYLDRRTLPLDPWGHDYVYLIPGSNGESFEVISYGRDGEPGGEGEDADISTAQQ